MVGRRSLSVLWSLAVLCGSGCATHGQAGWPSAEARPSFSPAVEAHLPIVNDELLVERVRFLADEDPLLHRAIETFRTAGRVECEGLGPGATLSDQFHARNVLLDRPDAPTLVAWLVPRATLEGRVALLDLVACTHPRAVEALRASLLDDAGAQTVDTACGCTGGSRTVASLLAQPPECPFGDLGASAREPERGDR